MNKITNNEKGFTFIEVLVSSVILLIVAMGVMSTTGVHIKSNGYALFHTKAVQVAESGAEMMMRKTQTEMAAWGGTRTEDPVSNHKNLSREIKVTDLGNSNYRIEVQVKRNNTSFNPVLISFTKVYND